MASLRTLELRRAPVDAQAQPCASADALLAHRAGAHWMELAPEGRQVLRPAVWLGAGPSPAFDARTARQPAVRVHAFADRPWSVGSAGLVNGGAFLDFDYAHFNETSRFNEFANTALVEASDAASITLRLPAGRRHVDGDCALLAQQGDTLWGHWLVDLLPRIGVVRRAAPHATLALPSSLAGVPRLLEHAGVDPARVVFYDPLTTILSADRLLVPSFPRFANGFSPLARALFEALSPQPRRRERRLYVTRSRTRLGSTLAGHLEVEALFAARGFEVVAPETLDVDAQLALFAQASHVAGEYGSGLHNTVYSAPGVPVLCLQSEGVAQFVQAGIGAAMAQPTGFVFGPVEPAMTAGRHVAPSFRERCFRPDPALVERGIEAMLDA